MPVPEPFRVTVRVWKSGGSVNVAVQLRAPLIVTTPSRQSECPLQPSKTEPAPALAVSVTTVFSTYVWLQSEPQLIPAGLLVTVPVPEPFRVTVRVWELGAVTVSVSSAITTTFVQGALVQVKSPPYSDTVPLRIQPR